MNELTDHERQMLIALAQEHADSCYWQAQKVEPKDIQRWKNEGDFWSGIANKLKEDK